MNQAVSERPLAPQLPLDVEGIAVASTSLYNVFNGKSIPSCDGGVIFGRLHLPEYQRPYRWSEEQLERLLDDLRSFFSSDAPAHDFYLGSIILHQEGGDGRQRGLLNIIDGQQRITSLALLHYLQHGEKGAPELKFNAPESHRRIQLNLRWLEQQRLPRIDFTRINVTLVVTRREDDAYRFFETQNTSGVRLGGADIVKAYHLRSVAAAVQDDFARTWESLGDLKPLVAAFMKSRHWQSLRWRNVASDRDPLQERKQIVAELAERTLPDIGDIAYRSLQVHRDAWGKETQIVQPGYAMCQPLGTGVNTMRVVTYFQGLHKTLLEVDKTAKKSTFSYYYKRLVHDACGSVFLSRAFNCAFFDYETGFICSVEQGENRGYHLHAAFFFNGAEVWGDVYKAIQIGELWERITRGQGHLNSSNHNKEKYEDRRSIGVILRNDRKIRPHVHDVMRYLVKDDQQLRLKPEWARSVRMGMRR